MRILISISETNGIVNFLNKLNSYYSEIEIIATSGTKKYLKSHNINSIEVSIILIFLKFWMEELNLCTQKFLVEFYQVKI